MPIRPAVLHLLLAAVVLVGVVLAAADFLTRPAAIAEAKKSRPIEVAGDGFTTSKQCRSCHPTEYASWHRSYHRTMTTEASSETVKGDFRDTQLMRQGKRIHLFEDEGQYFIDMEAPAGAEGVRDDGRMTMPIALVTGSHHMQIYWYETGYSRMLGQVPFVYDLLESRWIPRGAAFLRPHDKPRTGEMGRWNSGCINCHTTQGRPRMGANGEEPDTHVAEFGIACEACHGPGEQHIRDHQFPLSRYDRHFTEGAAAVPNIVQPGKLDAERASQICSQCHAMLQLVDGAAAKRWREDGHRYRPGKELIDRWLFQPSKREDDPNVERIIQDMPEYFVGMFWPDGEARVSSREYHGVVDSPCYDGGDFSCMSCHTLHKRADDPRSLDEWAKDMLGAQMDTNHACLQCHEDYADELEAHTKHTPGSSGSLCYNCHMPHTAYGLLKGIRSHKVTSPNVAANAEAGRPNACNLCHLDKSLEWTAQRLAADWNVKTPPLDMDQAALPAAAYWALEGDAGERALTAWSMGWEPARAASGDDWMIPLLAVLIDDSYQAVRYVSSRSLRRYPGYEDVHVDLTAGTEARRRDEMMQRWRAREGATMAGPAPLYRPSGELDEALIEQLLSERDETPLHLLE